MVPADVLNNILNILSQVAQVEQMSGMFYLPCSAGSGKSFSFDFGNVNVQVNLSEFLIPADTRGRHCALGFDSTQENQYTLGDTFLRSVYAVYDLENRQVGLAPASFNPTESNVVPFPSRGARIPSSTSGSGASGSANPDSSGDSAAPSLSLLWFDLRNPPSFLRGMELSLPVASIIAMAVTILISVI